MYDVTYTTLQILSTGGTYPTQEITNQQNKFKSLSDITNIFDQNISHIGDWVYSYLT
jgi:hypothetical protein